MAGLNAGALDREVTIEQLSEASSGFPTETWSELESGVWMSKEDLRGSERWQTAQLAARFDTRWRLQWRDDMDPDYVDVPKTRRLVYRGRIYDIVQAAEIGRREGIELSTIAMTTAGSGE